MKLDEAISKRGFRRWYERQLYEGHAYLVTGILALIMMAIALEVVQFRDSAQEFVVLLLISGGGGALCIHAWRQFTRLLHRAEYIGERATCQSCQAYAKFNIDAADDWPDAVAGCVLHVRCRVCGHAWSIR